MNLKDLLLVYFLFVFLNLIYLHTSFSFLGILTFKHKLENWTIVKSLAYEADQLLSFVLLFKHVVRLSILDSACY